MQLQRRQSPNQQLIATKICENYITLLQWTPSEQCAKIPGHPIIIMAVFSCQTSWVGPTLASFPGFSGLGKRLDPCTNSKSSHLTSNQGEGEWERSEGRKMGGSSRAKNLWTLQLILQLLGEGSGGDTLAWWAQVNSTMFTFIWLTIMLKIMPEKFAKA